MILLIGVLYIVLPVVQFSLFLMDLPFFRVFETINYFFAIVSYYWILNHILITIKIPFMQKHLPYDKLVKFHVITGTSLIIAMAYHVLYKIFAGKLIDQIGRAHV